MPRLLGYFVLIVCSVIYAVSLSSELTKTITTKKIELTNSAFESDAYRYGDLFGMSYLPGYKIEKSNSSVVKRDTCLSPKNTNLHIICDSYLWSFAVDGKDYCGVDTLLYAKTNAREKLYIKLNPNKRNVLLLEFSERNLRDLMRDSGYTNHFLNAADKSHVEAPAEEPKLSLLSRIRRFTFNKSINKNLELNVWDYALFTPVKELKSYINYKLFNVYDADVKISPDKKRLLYTATIDSTQIRSSFNELSANEVNSIVENLNQVFDKAKKMGYAEVYLSVIPNPVTIYYPHINHFKYNNLIDQVQSSAKLKPAVIDVYPAFKSARVNLYYPTDTHWNYNGVNIWLNEFNKHLRQDAAKR